LALLILLEEEVPVLVSLKLSTEICNVKSPSIEIEEPREITLWSHLLLVKFLAAILITDMSVLINKPALFIDNTSLFID
jgi:hypothetical protein